MDRSTTQPTPRRRRWPRRLGILAGILLLLVILAPLAVALPFVRHTIEERATEALGRPVTIASTSAFWFKGIDLEGVTVAAPKEFDEPLATVERVHVDLGLFALLGGDLEAEVLLEAPRVALLQDADGHSTTDGLFGAEPTSDTPATDPETSPPPATTETAEEADTAEREGRITVRIERGVIRAQTAPKAQVEEVRDLEVTALLDGPSLEVLLTALAAGAAAEGGDATIRADFALRPNAPGHVRLEVPPLDLTRLAGVVEGLSGFAGLTGRLGLQADLVTDADGMPPTGRADVQATGLVVRTPDDVRLAVGRLETFFERAAEPGAKERLNLRAENVEVLDERGEAPRRWREPLVHVALTTTSDGQGTTRIEGGEIRMGDAVSVQVSEPWTVEHGGAHLAASGQTDVRIDLSRLRDLLAFIPALEPLHDGRISARVVARTEGGFDLSAGVRVANLRIAPSDLAPTGHTEPDVLAQVRVWREDGEGDMPLQIQLHKVKTSFLDVGPAADAEPLVVSVADAGITARGALSAALTLEPLGRALGGTLGLEPGDRLGGTLFLRADAALAPDDGTVALNLDGRDVALPSSWAEGVPPTRITGQIGLQRTADNEALALRALKGFGLSIDARAAVSRHTDAGLQTADLTLTGDLDRARPLLAPFLGLEGRARLKGQLAGKSVLTGAADARRLAGNLTISDLAWQDADGRPLWNEERVELVHDIGLAAGGGALVHDLRLVSKALQATGRGSAPKGSLDLALDLGGDAGILAGLLRGMLGEDYRDLEGQGAIDGTVRLEGPTADGGLGLRANGTVKLGDWSTGGLALTATTLTVARPASTDPQRLGFTSGLNGGRADVVLELRRSLAATAWSLDATTKDVDTSALLVNRGAGEYLAYLLPTLVPSDKSTPVLSGLLDAEVNLGAEDTEEPHLARTLKGSGWVRMAEGAIGESTLFEAVGGGKGLGDAGQVLARAVPEVGRTLESLSKSLTFTRLESVFSVANRVVTITRGVLEGGRTKLDFRGTVAFNETVDMLMDVTLGGKAGERLAKVMPSKTPVLPLGISGRASDPRITPRIDLAGLAGGMLEGLIPGSGENPIDRLRGLLPR